VADAERDDMMLTGLQAGPLIVVGVDGTASSDAVVDWAVREARLRNSAVHLVMAWGPDSGRLAPYARPAAVGGGDDAGAARLAKAASRSARYLPPERVTSELVEGLPAQVLLERAAGAGLLVLGATRPAGYPPGLLGPITRACLRNAPCPVVVIAADSQRGRSPRRVRRDNVAELDYAASVTTMSARVS
jgi:nucleotide-binding universal stress UspA family protein